LALSPAEASGVAFVVDGEDVRELIDLARFKSFERDGLLAWNPFGVAQREHPLGLLLGDLLLGADVDAPVGQASRETHVLPLLADRQRLLIFAHDDGAVP
jgi:hypothetical protein